MSARIIWADRSGALVGGGEPEAVRYVRCDVYEIIAAALLQIGDDEDGVPNIEAARLIAWNALGRANDLP